MGSRISRHITRARLSCLPPHHLTTLRRPRGALTIDIKEHSYAWQQLQEERFDRGHLVLSTAQRAAVSTVGMRTGQLVSSSPHILRRPACATPE